MLCVGKFLQYIKTCKSLNDDGLTPSVCSYYKLYIYSWRFGINFFAMEYGNKGC